MNKKSHNGIGFSRVNGRKIHADFDGGDISTDGGLLLVEQIDRKLGLTGKVAKLVAAVTVGRRFRSWKQSISGNIFRKLRL
jgi:hypothetical protein